MPEATVAAFRNQWFHTGDRAWMDDDGYVFYVDRIKDCIRRRGENISSWEVERSIAAHPDVAEVAVVGVPSELTEEEVLAVVVLQARATSIEPLRCSIIARNDCPRFAVPRYVRFATELPEDPEPARREVQAARTRVSRSDTWDRDQPRLRGRSDELRPTRSSESRPDETIGRWLRDRAERYGDRVDRSTSSASQRTADRGLRGRARHVAAGLRATSGSTSATASPS